MLFELYPFGPREITGRDPRASTDKATLSIAKLVMEMFASAEDDDSSGAAAEQSPEQRSD